MWSSCRVGVQGVATVVPGAGAQEVETPSGCDRCLVRAVAASTCWAGIGQLVHAQDVFDHGHRGTERSLARVCREAGATVRCNTKLRDMNVHVPAQDERAIEVLASGWLAVEITPQKCSDRPGPCPPQRVQGEWRSPHACSRGQGGEVP